MYNVFNTWDEPLDHESAATDGALDALDSPYFLAIYLDDILNSEKKRFIKEIKTRVVHPDLTFAMNRIRTSQKEPWPNIKVNVNTEFQL